MFVLLPDVFVCVFSSLAESAMTGLEIIAMVISIANKIKFLKNHFIIHFPYPNVPSPSIYEALNVLTSKLASVVSTGTLAILTAYFLLNISSQWSLSIRVSNSACV